MKTIHKAVTASAFGLAGAFGTALLDGQLTYAECLISLGTGLLAGVATYNAPYRDRNVT